MWLYFDKNGVLKIQVQNGQAARAGTTNFDIFAVFEGVYADSVVAPTYSNATLKLIRPDYQSSEYPILIMESAVEKVYEGTTNQYFTNGQTYKGYYFNFNTFGIYDTDNDNSLDDEDAIVLLDMPGVWKSIITLVGSNRTLNVVGRADFNVEEGSTSQDETILSLNTLLNQIYLSMATKLDIKADRYLHVLPSIPSASLSASEWSVNDIVYVKNTKKFYTVSNLTGPVLTEIELDLKVPTITFGSNQVVVAPGTYGSSHHFTLNTTAAQQAILENENNGIIKVDLSAFSSVLPVPYLWLKRNVKQTMQGLTLHQFSFDDNGYNYSHALTDHYIDIIEMGNGGAIYDATSTKYLFVAFEQLALDATLTRIYNCEQTLANNVVKTTGNQEIAGQKTFKDKVTIKTDNADKWEISNNSQYNTLLIEGHPNGGGGNGSVKVQIDNGNAIVAADSFVPKTTETEDLGSEDAIWNKAFVNTLTDGVNEIDVEDIAAKSIVSGTNDGTNWQTITINGTTKNIPTGGGGGGATNIENGTGDYSLVQKVDAAHANQANEDYSSTFGKKNISGANGWAAFTTGTENTNNGDSAFVTGAWNINSGYAAIVGGTSNSNTNRGVIIGGTNNTNVGKNLLMVGQYNTITHTYSSDLDADNSLIGGKGNEISGATENAVISGSNNKINAQSSLTVGQDNENMIDKGAVIGYKLKTNNRNLIAVGKYNDDSTNLPNDASKLFAVGNGDVLDTGTQNITPNTETTYNLSSPIVVGSVVYVDIEFTGTISSDVRTQFRLVQDGSNYIPSGVNTWYRVNSNGTLNEAYSGLTIQNIGTNKYRITVNTATATKQGNPTQFNSLMLRGNYSDANGTIRAYKEVRSNAFEVRDDGTIKAEKLTDGTTTKTITQVLAGSAPSNMVTTDTEQTISGQKTFSEPIITDAIVNSSSANYAFGFDATLAGPTIAVGGNAVAFNGTTFFADPTNENSTDLGKSNAKWKDLYLSGGISTQATGGASSIQLKLWKGTQAQYDSITTPDANTLYIIV